VDAGSDITLCNQPISYDLTGYSPSNGVWSGSPNISSAGIFTPSGTEISDLQYLYTDPSTGCQNSDIVVVTVEPPVIPNVLPTYSICANNAAINLHAVLDPLPAGGNWTGAGVNNPTFTPSVAGAGVHIITYTIGTETCLTSVTSTITVNPPPNLTPIGPTTICNNTALNVNLASDIPSSFVWQAQATSTVGGEVSSAQTSSVINNTLSNTTTNPQNVVYTVTPTSVPQGCVGTSSNFSVTVMPDVILAIPTAIEICSGSSVNAQLSANVPSDFSWFTSFDNPNVIGESIAVNTGTLINDILVNNSANDQLVIYSITPTSINGACNGLSQTITVTVKPPFALLNNNAVTICSGSSVDLALVANTSVTFNWFALPAVDVFGESITTTSSQTITDVLTNNTASIKEVLYNVIGTSSADGCSSPIFPVQVFVNPVPFMSDPIDQVICNGLPTQAVNLTSTVSNSTFTWSNTNSSIGLAASGVGVIPSFTAVNNTNAPVTATITVNVSFENAGVTCTGNTQTFTITVNPTSSVTQLNDQELCNGDVIGPINFNGNIFGTVFTWTNDLPTIGLTATGTGSIALFAAINTTTVTEMATISVTPNYTIGGVTCLGQPQDFTITIHPSALITSTGTTICSNDSFSLPITASLPASITWQANNNTNVTGESLTLNSSATISDLLVNPGSLAEVINYQVAFVATGFGCPSGPFNIPVTVQPLPDVNFEELNLPLCNLDPIQFQNSTPGANSYVWNFGDGNTSTLPNPTYIYQSPGTYSVSLTATNNLTGCFDSFIRSLVIQESPTVDFDISTNQGCLLLDVVFTDLVNAPNTIMSWDFGDGQTSNQPNVVDHQYVSPGCFDVSLTAVNLIGCSTTLTQSDLVCAFAQPNASFFSTPDSVNIDNPQIVFTNQSTNAYTYVWDFGDGGSSVSTNPTHVYAAQPDNYVVTLYAYSQADCYDSLMMNIRVYEDIIYYVPNAFTPDNDGINDLFMPELTSGLDINNYELLIFNRWGEQIFESHDRDIGWDGSYMNGDYLCEVGVYTWRIVIKASQNNDIITQMGHVTLLR
jgi:gliding motility-associated-like protein